MVIEYMGGGDLSETLGKTRAGDNEALRVSIIDVASVIVHTLADLHRLEKVHRDVTSLNIFLSNTYNIRLADLGTTRRESFASTTTKADAPTPADISSCRVVLTELDTCDESYANAKNRSAIQKQVHDGQLRPTMSPNCEPRHKALPNQCLEGNPAKRPSAEDITTDVLTAHRDGNDFRDR
ncbi:hypothetical protein SPRG_08994 [Saprolegnia parasitica CBS 223.65]|uniref:Protein kinase domain-containing protein n=1 Tax=Saprolegnia parasitica (strain CBS 223.65) TaxID=695850 RepID=A0A067C990_SAPPC|nr:hypothetical protein SPRG_08994 [Saprolegnia parasitica CBS 223.65]KDO25695.1 hypothetical protein SPRG_08994 [Saprolegnia parasitica CBS 223.65]|eukprot:XP_012203505.1 hypothetical protein SPRG_08994 [Saprolegnia parasitica CBS 223.65]